jgi:hypothetical protein
MLRFWYCDWMHPVVVALLGKSSPLVCTSSRRPFRWKCLPNKRRFVASAIDSHNEARISRPVHKMYPPMEKLLRSREVLQLQMTPIVFLIEGLVRIQSSVTRGVLELWMLR